MDKTTNGKQGGAILKVTNNSTEGMTDEMTFCYRFKIKVLGNAQNRPRGMLLNIADWYSENVIIQAISAIIIKYINLGRQISMMQMLGI